MFRVSSSSRTFVWKPSQKGPIFKFQTFLESLECKLQQGLFKTFNSFLCCTWWWNEIDKSLSRARIWGRDLFEELGSVWDGRYTKLCIKELCNLSFKYIPILQNKCSRFKYIVAFKLIKYHVLYTFECCFSFRLGFLFSN